MKKLTWTHAILAVTLTVTSILIWAAFFQAPQCKCHFGFGYATQIKVWTKLKFALELGLLCSSAALGLSHVRARRTQIERWLVTRRWLLLTTALFMGGVVTSYAQTYRYERLDAAFKNPPKTIYITSDGRMTTTKP